MTAPQIPRRDFYVYALLRADGQTPFYIGKGQGNRINIHEREAPRRTSHKDRIIQNMLADGITTIPKLKLLEGLTDAEAKGVEVALIQLLGRWPTGPLANLTSGGDGVADLAETSRAKKSAANRLSWADPEVKRKRSDGMKAVWTPEKRAEHSKMKTAAMTPSARQKLSAGQKARWDGKRKPKPPKKHQPTMMRALWTNPEWRAKVLAARKKTRAENPISQERAAAGAARLNRPDVRTKSRATNAIPEINERRIAAQRAAFSTPEAKAKRSIASKKMWAAKRGH